MEEALICHDHRQPIKEICVGCKGLMCYKCSTMHTEKNHGGGMDLPSYAAKYVVPRYRAMLKELTTAKYKYTSLAKKATAALFEVIGSLKEVLENLQRAFTQLTASFEALSEIASSPQQFYDQLENSLLSEQEQLYAAIKNESMKDILAICAINHDPIPNATINTAAVEDIRTTLADIQQYHGYDQLQDLLHEYMHAAQIADPTLSKEPLATLKHAYFLSVANKDQMTLARFDTHTRRLEELTPVPLQSDLIQLEARVFVSGGNLNSTIHNTLSEYDPKVGTLVARTAMKTARARHSTAAISPIRFVTVGGHDGNSSLALCECYDAKANEWTELPPLNQARCGHATIFDYDAFVYAIGGQNQETVEKLNLATRSSWDIVDVVGTGLSLGEGVGALMIDSGTILILKRAMNGVMDCGLLDPTKGTLEKWEDVNEQTAMLDRPQPVIIQGKPYFLGDRGHVKLLDWQGAALIRLDFSGRWL